MPRRRETVMKIEIEAIGPGIEIFRVTGYGPMGELFLFFSPEDGELRTVLPARGVQGCRVPDRWIGGLPPLHAVIAGAFPGEAA